MLVLALEAATRHLSLAVAEGSPGDFRVLGEREVPPEVSSSKVLPGAVASLLAEHGKRIDELSALIADRGPGSFTGLRLAMACAKGISYVHRVPVIGVPSLEAMAHAATAEVGDPRAWVVPALDARRHQLFAGLFHAHGATLEVVEPRLAATPEQLASQLAGDREVVLFGEGELAYRTELKALAYRTLNIPRPRARDLVARCPPIPAYDAEAMFALEPYYVRRPEEEWTLKPKKAKPAP